MDKPFTPNDNLDFHNFTYTDLFLQNQKIKREIVPPHHDFLRTFHLLIVSSRVIDVEPCHAAKHTPLRIGINDLGFTDRSSGDV